MGGSLQDIRLFSHRKNIRFFWSGELVTNNQLYMMDVTNDIRANFYAYTSYLHITIREWDIIDKKIRIPLLKTIRFLRLFVQPRGPRPAPLVVLWRKEKQNATPGSVDMLLHFETSSCCQVFIILQTLSDQLRPWLIAMSVFWKWKS
jgi:hypothetical protein